jgi:ribosome-associated toxin RatA of RatAB toxin-antitoxin module
LRVLTSGLVIILSCSPAFAAEPQATPGEWKLISNSEQVALYRRTIPGPGHYETKAVGEIAASSTIVHAVIDDVDSYTKFMPYTVEARVIKRDGDTLLGYQRLSTPLISDRDYTLRVRTTEKNVDGGTSYLTRWETENASGPTERPGVVRVKICDGGWLLEPAGPAATRATYSIYTDSGGAIPSFIKNVGSQIGIRKLFAALRKQVQNPKYLPKK